MLIALGLFLVGLLGLVYVILSLKPPEALNWDGWEKVGSTYIKGQTQITEIESGWRIRRQGTFVVVTKLTNKMLNRYEPVSEDALRS